MGIDEGATDVAAVCAKLTSADESAAVDKVNAANVPFLSNQTKCPHQPHARR